MKVRIEFVRKGQETAVKEITVATLPPVGELIAASGLTSWDGRWRVSKVSWVLTAKGLSPVIVLNWAPIRPQGGGVPRKATEVFRNEQD